MVSLILLSHSPKIVEGIKDLAFEMGGDTNVIPIGGSKAGTLGADYDRILAAMNEAAAKGEVIVLADLGSAQLTGQMAQEALPAALRERVFLSNAALVEGGVVAAVGIASGQSAEKTLAQLEEYTLPK